MTADFWREIPSAPGYFAGADGSIRGRKGWVLRPKTEKKGGYLVVTIYRADGTRKDRKVHCLICEAFHGLKPSDAHQVAHWDGNPSNNDPENLRWATAKENSSDKNRHGTHPCGERNGNAKINRKIAGEIRRVYAASMGPVYVKRGTRAALAKKYGVRIDVIKQVVSGECWADVSSPPFLPPLD